MTKDQPRPQHVFEAKAGPLPKLRSVAAPPADDAAGAVLEEDEAPAAGLRAKRRRQAGAASREVILRIVEAVKAL